MYKLFIYDQYSEDFRSTPAWQNFTKTTTTSTLLSDLSKYNAKFYLGSTMRQDHLLFDTEQDMMMFLLRWS